MLNPINNLKIFGFSKFSKKIFILKSNDNYYSEEINLNKYLI